MAGQEEDLSDQADERMGIEVRRDGMKAYLQEAGIYGQLVKAMVRMYHGRGDKRCIQGIDGLKQGLGASDEEVAELETNIQATKVVEEDKNDLIKELHNQLKQLRGYSFEELLAFREILRGEMKEDPVPDPPLIPMQNCMETWLKQHSLLRFEVKQAFEAKSFVKFNQLLPFLPEFLMSEEVKDQVKSEKLEWKEVLVPATDDNGQNIFIEQVDAEGMQLYQETGEFDEEGNAVKVPIPAKQKFKKYYYNRANGYTTWQRPEVMGEDMDMTEEEKEQDQDDGKIRHKYKMFDFLDVQKDGDWYKKTTIIKKGKKKKMREIEVHKGGYEPAYVISLNEDGTYDIQYGRREPSTWEKQMMTTWDDEGNEMEVEQDVEIIGDIVVEKGVKANIMKPWNALNKLPSGDAAKSFKQMKAKLRVSYMKYNYIKTGTVGSTPREIKSEQAANIDKFLKELKRMRLECKDMYYSEKEKVEKAIEAKKPLIRKEHYKKLNKKLKSVGIKKEFRKKIAVALKLLDKPAKQMKDRLPKILQSLYKAGIKDVSENPEEPDVCYVIEVEEEVEDSKPPRKEKVWKKLEAKEVEKIEKNSDMGRIAHSIFDDDLEKFEAELLYKLQGIHDWENWVDNLDDFTGNISIAFTEWMEELEVAEVAKRKEEAEENAKNAAAAYPAGSPFEGEENTEIYSAETWEDDEEIKDLWQQFYNMKEDGDTSSIADGDKDEVQMWLSNIFNGRDHCPNEEDHDEGFHSDEYNKIWNMWKGGEKEFDKKKMDEESLKEHINMCYDTTKEGQYGGNQTTRLQHIWLIKESVGLPHP